MKSKPIQRLVDKFFLWWSRRLFAAIGRQQEVHTVVDPDFNIVPEVNDGGLTKGYKP